MFYGSAAYGAAWIYEIYLRRYNADGVAVFSRNGDGVVNVIHHEDAAEKVSRQGLVFRPHMDEIRGDSDGTRFF